MRLASKTAMVTGAHGGIGYACAALFAAEGARVIAADIRADAPAYLAGVDYRELDVRSAASWEALFGYASGFGGVDVLVNAAGIGGHGAIDDVTLDSWNDVLAVNLTGVMLGSQLAVRDMLAHGRGGSIVTISSIWGSVATPGFAAYQTTKGAVVLLSRNIAVSHAEAGIRANCIHPGLIDTPMSQANPDEFNAGIVAATPMKRIGQPDDVAHGALYLASDESRYVTGTSLFIDGGFTAV
jgi:NAD(P)-dependent dehydrogenase (short-subunit alcohol dehydrogenase family)